MLVVATLMKTETIWFHLLMLKEKTVSNRCKTQNAALSTMTQHKGNLFKKKRKKAGLFLNTTNSPGGSGSGPTLRLSCKKLKIRDFLTVQSIQMTKQAFFLVLLEETHNRCSE